MSTEHLQVQIENALYLMQLITEDLEDNFIGADVGSDIKARATLTVSSLNILSDYLQRICKEVSV